MVPTTTGALECYEALAPFYDAFTDGYRTDAWVGRLADWAVEHGLRGPDVLDIACGTGRSFPALRARGFRVTGCDLSAAMLAQARRRDAGAVTLLRADMRDLPFRERFDWAVCLDDSLNYLAGEAELSAAFAAARRALRDGGLYLFDLNTLAAFRTAFAAEHGRRARGCFFVWRGRGSADHEPDTATEALLEVFAREGGAWRRTGTVHRQRHFSHGRVVRLLADEGLHLLAVRGQFDDGVAREPLDELAHRKAIYLAQRPSSLTRGEEVMARARTRAARPPGDAGARHPEDRLATLGQSTEAASRPGRRPGPGVPPAPPGGCP